MKLEKAHVQKNTHLGITKNMWDALHQELVAPLDSRLQENCLGFCSKML